MNTRYLLIFLVLIPFAPTFSQDLEDGIAAAALGNIAEADALFRDAYKKNPDAGPPGCALALLYDKSGSEADMRLWLEKTAHEYPNDPEAFLLLAQLALGEERLIEAKLMAEHGFALLDSTTKERRIGLEMRVLNVLAAYYEKHNDWENAKQKINRMLELKPQHAPLFERLARALFFLGQIDEAVLSQNKAFDLDNKFLPGCCAAAQFFHLQGNREESEKWLNVSLEKHGENVSVLLMAAALKIAWNEIDKAAELAKKARLLAPGAWEAKRILAHTALYQKNFADAHVLFQEMLLDNATDSVAIDGMAIALSEMDDPFARTRALTYAKLNVRDFPDSPQALSTLAWVLFRMEQYDNAKAVINRLLTKNTMTPMSSFTYAKILLKAGQKEESLFYFEQSLSSKQNFLKRSEAETLRK